jgi:2-polyprenyl-6-methoxyphenol hydroxylase-like FAD-dependent oxidoreductase
MNLDSNQPNVVVVGAGPVGLWVAAELALAGVSTLVLERAVERSPHSKAMGMHPRTVEVLALRGAEKRFLADGVPVPNWHFGMLENRLDFGGLDTPYPYMLAFPQARTEEVFEQRALDLGVRIRRGHAVTGLVQDSSSVTLTLDDSSTVTASYVVGADGAGSTVRKAAGIDFPGADATTFGYVGEVALTDRPVTSAQTDDGALITVPLGGGRYRLAGMDAHRQGPDDPFTLDDLRATTIRVAGSDFGMHDPTWLSRFGNATRVAAEYRKGRVLLAGDAAHMHFPAGGVGLNVGVQDAANLGWKLAAVATGRAPSALLDTYHAERHPVGADLLRATRAQTALMTSYTPEIVALRSMLSDFIADVPDFSRVLAERLSALDVAYPAPEDAHPLTGHRAPDLRFTDGSGLFALLRDGRHVSIGTRPHDSVLAGTAEPVIAGTLLDPPGEWASVSAALVRPDGHVAWAMS